MTNDGRATHRISPIALEAEAWQPFGWLPRRDTDPEDGRDRLTYAWGDPHVNIIGHARSEVPEVAEGLRCEMLYRHETHTQVLMALDVPSVIVVAPGSSDFASPEQAEVVRAFRLEPLEPLVLWPGTWHWGPFPVAAPAVSLFNVQGLGYADDNACVDLAERGMSIDVLLG
jgi:Ureidoglycolate lyase